jgi:hypothetical protein
MARGPAKGNQFWMLRAKHGKDAIFKTPQSMFDAACEYFTWCENNPVELTETHIVPVVLKNGTKTSKAQRVKVYKRRVFLMTGLCLYFGTNEKFFYNFKNNKMCTPEFVEVIRMIEDTIRTQKHTMGYSGEAPANIVTLDLGMRQGIDLQAENVNYNVPLSKEEAREISKALEEEY